VLRHLESHPCVDCGEHDPVVLQFHHVRGKKRDNVGSLVADSYEWHVVENEIAKCVVLCANCHTRRTALSRGHYRARRARKWVDPDVRMGQDDLPAPTGEADTLELKRPGTTSATGIDDPTVL
jgi:5-methylcytosine-specific restriction endonuclease McrA